MPSAPLSYGCDQSGLVCGYRFSAGQRGRPIEAAQATQGLRRRA